MSFSWTANAKEHLCYKMPISFSWTASAKEHLGCKMPTANVKKHRCYKIADVVLMACKCKATFLRQNVIFFCYKFFDELYESHHVKLQKAIAVLMMG